MFRILLVIIPLFIASSSLAKGWEEISHEDGVRVWSKEAKNSEIMMFRGQKTMNLPLSKVAFVLLNDNIEQKKRWIDRIEEFVIVERSETFGSAVTYSTYALPFPLSDRDFVIKSTRILDEKNQKVTLSIKSVKHPKYKADDSIGVRGQILNSSFILEGIEGTKKTRVTVEIQADPGGLLPIP